MKKLIDDITHEMDRLEQEQSDLWQRMVLEPPGTQTRFDDYLALMYQYGALAKRRKELREARAVATTS